MARLKSKLSLKLDSAAEQKMRAAIAEQASKHIRTLIIALHKRILTATPMNTGRTLGSWVGSIGTPILKDVADDMGHEMFRYVEGGQPKTNHLPIGSEPDRRFLETYSLQTTLSLPISSKNPYQIYYVSNGAELDSGFGLYGGDDLPSGLLQGPGSRALYQEYGWVASYDTYNDIKGHFKPRGLLLNNGLGMVRSSIDYLNLNYRKILNSRFM